MACEFGDFLRGLRKFWGLTQDDVAGDFGVTGVVYCKYETEATEPSFETLKALSDYYGYSLTDIIARFYYRFGRFPANTSCKRPKPDYACATAKEHMEKAQRRYFKPVDRVDTETIEKYINENCKGDPVVW